MVLPPFQSCIHTCGHDVNRMTAHGRRGEANLCPIFNRSGNTIKNHLKNKDAHPNCRATCPGNPWIQPFNKNPSLKFRETTHDEWVTWGAILYPVLTPNQKGQFPLYYLPMASQLPRVEPPPPPPGTDIYLTYPHNYSPNLPPLLPPNAHQPLNAPQAHNPPNSPPAPLSDVHHPSSSLSSGRLPAPVASSSRFPLQPSSSSSSHRPPALSPVPSSSRYPRPDPQPVPSSSRYPRPDPQPVASSSRHPQPNRQPYYSPNHPQSTSSTQFPPLETWSRFPPTLPYPPPDPTEFDPLTPRYDNQTIFAEVKKGIRVTFVEDPSHDYMSEKPSENLEWTLSLVDEQFAAKALEHCPSNIVQDPEGSGMYYMRDFLTYGSYMTRRGWQVDIIEYKAFFNAVSKRSGDDWDRLTGMDMVVGGADLSGDYMNPAKKFRFTSRKAFYNYNNGLNELGTTVLIWPHPRDLLQGGRKIMQLRTHAEVAHEIRAPFGPLSYPSMHPIASWSELRHLNVSNLVIKREYAECGDSVLFESHGDMKKRFEEGIKTTARHWNVLEKHWHPNWFVQPKLPTMAEKCEARIFFLGGRPTIGAITGNGAEVGSIEGNPLHGVLPLAQLAPGPHTQVETLDEMARWSYLDVYESAAPYEMMQVGKHELYQYATYMLKGLIRKEEEWYGNNKTALDVSGLRFFARLDIGILRVKATGRFVFWLSEVERTHNTGHFNKFLKDQTLTIAPSVVGHWETFIAQMRLDQAAASNPEEGLY